MGSVVDLSEKRARKEAENLGNTICRRLGQVADKGFIEGLARILLEGERETVQQHNST